MLRHLDKGHTRADVVEALDILRRGGHPDAPDLRRLHAVDDRATTTWTCSTSSPQHDLVEHVDPIQFAIRLLVPPGSALLDEPDARQWLGPLDEAAFSYRLGAPRSAHGPAARRGGELVEAMASGGCDNREIYDEIRALAERVLGLRGAARAGTVAAGQPVPHLTEPWFC